MIVASQRTARGKCNGMRFQKHFYILEACLSEEQSQNQSREPNLAGGQHPNLGSTRDQMGNTLSTTKDLNKRSAELREIRLGE